MTTLIVYSRKMYMKLLFIYLVCMYIQSLALLIYFKPFLAFVISKKKWYFSDSTEWVRHVCDLPQLPWQPWTSEGPLQELPPDRTKTGKRTGNSAERRGEVSMWILPSIVYSEKNGLCPPEEGARSRIGQNTKDKPGNCSVSYLWQIFLTSGSYEKTCEECTCTEQVKQ